MVKVGLVLDVYVYGELIHGWCMKEASKLFMSLGT
jgi:hypothetical protein